MALLTLSTVAALVLCSFARHIPTSAHRYELAKRVPGHLSKRAIHTNARLTYYDTNGGYGACDDTPLADSQWIVALNAVEFGSGYPAPNCNRGITIEYQGKQVHAVIRDKCPICPYGGLDLTRPVFWALTDVDTPIETATWWYNDDAPPNASTSVKPTTTQKPKSSTTSEPPPPSTTEKPKPSTTSMKLSSSSSSSSAPPPTSSTSSSAGAAASSTDPAATSSGNAASASTVANAGDNGGLDNMYQAVLNLGSMVVAGAQTS